jgi:hypothetical protein
MKYFFLILLIIVLIYLSVKPMEGFDASNNSLNDSYTISNIAFFTIVFILFIVLIFLFMKLRSL